MPERASGNVRAMNSPTGRATAALAGLAIGDALGMPTQAMSPQQIAEKYGVITNFVASDGDQPIAPNTAAGTITDDTEQALLVADLLIVGDGHIDALDFADALLAWEADVAARGSLDLLGPSTKAALQALSQGVPPTESGKNGTTNGAAMRVTPVGIANPPGPRLLAAVIEASLVTHGTSLGLAGAAAVAGAVTAGIAGASMPQALEYAVQIARAAEAHGHWVAGASVPERLVALGQLAAELSDEQFADYLRHVVGTALQTQESVVCALLIAQRFVQRPFDGLCLAASIGGDTDTIGCMAGAILGAVVGQEAWPAAAVQIVSEVNQIDFTATAEALLSLRG